jgi:hypothetical protein
VAPAVGNEFADPHELRGGTVLAVHLGVVRFALLVVLVGCAARLGGGTTEESGLNPDAAVVKVPDAAQQLPDAPSGVADNSCGVASTQGNLGNLTGQAGVATQGTTTAKVYFVGASTSLTATQATPDVLQVELWDGYGVFAGGAARTGTFSITGDETDYDTCGVCVLTLANVTNNTPTKMLFATSGTVTVTTIGTAAGQTTQVTVSNASFVETVNVTDQGYQPVTGSNCPSPISNAGLSGTI